LGNKKDITWEFQLQPGQRLMSRIGVYTLQLAAACIVKTVDQAGIALEGSPFEDRYPTRKRRWHGFRREFVSSANSGQIQLHFISWMQ
jgi:hypothetical protein